MTDQEGYTMSVSEMRRHFDNRKREFDVWCLLNKNAAGTTTYDEYVISFKTWEVAMKKAIADKELEDRQNRSHVGKDVDTELRELLENVDMKSFCMALLHATEEDKSILEHAKKFHCNTPSVDTPLIAQLRSSHSRPVLRPDEDLITATGLISFQSPIAYPSPSFPPNLSTPVMPHGHLLRPTPALRTHGTIPYGWTVDPPLIRPENLPPPPKSYDRGPTLPFSDLGR